MTLDTHQKMAALHALNPDVSIRYSSNPPGGREPFWYLLTPGVEIKDRSVLKSVGGRGANPYEAIEATWSNAAEDLPSAQYLVINAADPDRRRAVRWNGFMWADVIEPKE